MIDASLVLVRRGWLILLLMIWEVSMGACGGGEAGSWKQEAAVLCLPLEGESKRQTQVGDDRWAVSGACECIANTTFQTNFETKVLFEPVR